VIGRCRRATLAIPLESLIATPAPGIESDAARAGGERSDRSRFVESIVRHIAALYWWGSCRER
jgi:hypothetical protein